MRRVNLSRLLNFTLLAVVVSAADSTQAERAQERDAVTQYRLGMMYATGDGVPKDSGEAVKWFRKAAFGGDVSAQVELGYMLAEGIGVPKDEVEALAWFNVAAAAEEEIEHTNIRHEEKRKLKDQIDTLNRLGQALVEDYRAWFRKSQDSSVPDVLRDDAHREAQRVLADIQVKQSEVKRLKEAEAQLINPAVKNRDMLEQKLGSQMTLVAQRRSKLIFEEIENARHGLSPQIPNSSPITSAPETPIASGSGAIVSVDGYVLTAAHVIIDARKIEVLTSLGVKSAKVVKTDVSNDLAVLKLSEGNYAALSILSSRTIRLGQSVSTIGFPNIEIQGFSPKVTRGEISSLSGFGDDPRMWQISVPVQTGNSGGPLLDESGNLVGVVVSKLGLRAASVTGDLPQNVNYAVKGTYALALLESYLGNDAPESSTTSSRPQFEDMIAKAQQSVVLILAY